RQNRVSDGPVRAFGLGMGTAQDKKSKDSKYVENQHRKNNVVEELAVTAGDAKYAGPRHLHHQRNRRRLVDGMKLGNVAKEQTVFCHRVVDSRARQNQSIAAAKTG